MDPVLLVVVAGTVVLLACGGYLFWLLRRQRRAWEEEFHHFRCPGCRRRLRFRARQVGHKGKCSHCGHDVIFPSVAESID
jgi:hypothetical protein